MKSLRSTQGVGLFYHRDSKGSHDQTLPEYVEWARARARELKVEFDGAATRIVDMAMSGTCASGDLFLDYGVAGNLMSRPGLDALIQRIKSDPRVSHVFVARRDRLARPDDTMDGILLERELRQLGVTIVYTAMSLAPLLPGQRSDLSEQLMEVVDFHETGRFRAELAEKMLRSHASLAKQAFSTGGRAPYGFCRWLVDPQGQGVRELGPGEVVRLAGHHVRWLPGLHAELTVILRILKLLLTMPASRIAKLFNAEGIPSPGAGRRRKDHGVRHEVSGLWHANTIINIARNPLLVGTTSYGQRSMGDQRRHSPEGPRELEAGDRREDQKPKVIRNPEESIIRAKSTFTPIVEAGKQASLITILDERGKTQRGKPRSRDPGKNPLGGRIFDLACSSLMYRIPYQETFRYRCGLYETSHGQQCSHNHVDGMIASRFALAAVQQQICSPEARKKLEVRLRKRAEAEASSQEQVQLLKAKELELDEIEKDLKQVARNMARAKDDQFEAISEYFDELKAKRDACEKEITELRRHSAVRKNPEDEVAAMLKLTEKLHLLAEDAGNLPALGQLFNTLNVRMFLNFERVQKKKRIENKLASGMLTMGAAPLPIDLEAKPAVRSALKLQPKNAARSDLAADAKPCCSGLEAKSLGNVNRDETIVVSKSLTDLHWDIGTKEALETVREVVVRLTGTAPEAPARGTLSIWGRHPDPKVRLDAGGDHLLKENEVLIKVPVGMRLSIRPERLIGYQFENLDVEITAGEGPQLIEIPVQPAGGILSTIVRPDGSPATDGIVTVVVIQMPPGIKKKMDLNRIVHDRASEILSSLPLGGRYQILAREFNQDRLAWAISPEISLDQSQPIAKVRLQLLEGRPVSIRVLAPDGQPARGISVFMNANFWPNARTSYVNGAMRTTDDRGVALFQSVSTETTLPGMKIKLEVAIAPARHCGWKSELDLQNPPEVRLTAGLTASGVLIEASSGKPIPFAPLRLIPQHFGEAKYYGGPETTTDRLGRFQFEGMEPIEYRAYHNGLEASETIAPAKPPNRVQRDRPEDQKQLTIGGGDKDIIWKANILPGSPLKVAD